MKYMKLIMENFKKKMKEGWPGAQEPTVPWAGKSQKNWDKEIKAKSAQDTARKNAEIEVINFIKNKYGKDTGALYNEPRPMRALVSYIRQKFEQIAGMEADEQSILYIVDRLDILDPKIGAPGSLEALFSQDDDEEFDPRDV